jgi:hypothetical protein
MLGIVIPTDFHIFRGVETTNQTNYDKLEKNGMRTWNSKEAFEVLLELG